MMDAVPDLAALAELLNGIEPQPSRTLHAHPDVVLWLALTLPEAEPEPLTGGSLAALTGIPVIKAPDLERGAWELREGDRVVTSGHVDLPSHVREFQFEPVPFPDLTPHFDLQWQLRRQFALSAPLPFAGLTSGV